MGLICGVIGPLFVKCLEFVDLVFAAIPKIPGWAKPALGGLIVGGIGYVYPEILGDGAGPMNLAIRGNAMGWELLIALALLKMAATSITLGSGASGGTFAPSLFIGAMAGGAYGVLMNAVFPGFTAGPGSYSLVGMAATAAAAAHAPMTMIVMLF